MQKLKETFLKNLKNLWEVLRYKTAQEKSAVKKAERLERELLTERRKVENLGKQLKERLKREKVLGIIKTGKEVMEMEQEIISNAEQKIVCIDENMYFKEINNKYIGEAKFIKCLFNHMTFTNITFENIQFLDSMFENTKFINCKLKNCIFKGTLGYELEFVDCEFEETNIEEITMYKMVRINNEEYKENAA